MPNGDIYQVTDVAYNNDQQFLNVYFYRRDSVVADVGDDASTLADSFEAAILDAVKACQNASVLHTEIRVQNLFDSTDAHTKLISTLGELTSVDEAPIFLAVDVGLEHDNAAIRQGRKAIGGLDENQMSNGVVASAGFIASLASLMAALIDPLLYGVVDTFFPVIVGRILEGGVYRLPETALEATYGGVESATYNPLISTQNSRKQGVGV